MKRMGVWQRAVLAVLVAAGLGLLVYPAPEPGFHGFHPRVQGLYAVSFLLVALALLWIVGPRFRQFLESRYERIRLEVEEARRQFLEAEERLVEVQTRLENLTREVGALMAEFRALGERERDSLARAGAILAEKVRAEADFVMSQAVKAARQELRVILVDRALEIARRRLQGHEGAKMPDALVERFARDVACDLGDRQRKV